MARASTPTMIPLDRWAQLVGIDPRHFNQVTLTAIKPLTTCGTVWKQYAWQERDAVGREDVAMAIEEAEDQISRLLGYKLIPVWQADERHLTPPPGPPELLNRYALDASGFWLSVRTDWGHLLSGGIQAKTLIDDAVAVVYSDADGDGYEETATVTVATTVTDEEEIAVYFPGEGGTDEWEVKPLRLVSISAGIATITMWRHQLVDPDLWEALAPEAVEGTVDANFLATVDVYRRWNNPQQQAQLIWSPRPNTCDCGSVSCVACTYAMQWGCLHAQDHRLGLVSYRPATWDADDEEFDAAELSVNRNPDRLRLWYYAGHQDQRRRWPKLQMDPQLERAVTYFSLTLLDREVCDCCNLEGTVKKWREELNLNLPGGSYQLNESALNCPLGQTRGALFAWNVVTAMGRRLGAAVKY